MTSRNDPAVVRARAQARRSLWDYYDAVVARTPAPLTPVLLEEWERQAAQLRALIHSALGVTPHRPVEVEVEWLGATEFETYRIERLAYRTREEFVVPANLYVPTNVTGRLPAIIAPHGHAQNGKAHANYQALYIGLVRKGFIVLAPDCIGHGERRALGHRRLGSPFLIGTSLMGMELWDIMKGIDLLVARDDVDPRRIGCVGNSGGGTQTIWGAALDERIAAAVASDATAKSGTSAFATWRRSSFPTRRSGTCWDSSPQGRCAWWAARWTPCFPGICSGKFSGGQSACTICTARQTASTR